MLLSSSSLSSSVEKIEGGRQAALLGFSMSGVRSKVVSVEVIASLLDSIRHRRPHSALSSPR